jgi:hypothetical protein
MEAPRIWTDLLENSESPSLWTYRDWQAIVCLGVFFGIMLIGSWQRWTLPIIDHGREMNLPARVLAGEQLYRDVQFLYGPFAPYFNAFLYRIFGVHLAVLHGAGAVSAAIVLFLIYWLARQVMGVREASLATGLVLVICAIKSTANYISPYAYASLYGLVFALTSLAFTVRYWREGRQLCLVWSGILAGFALISKWEIALAALATALTAIAFSSRSARRLLWRDAIRFALPLTGIAAVASAFILSRVEWRTLLAQNHILFTNMPPQLVYFNRQLSGLAEWPGSFWYMVSGFGMFVLWAGVIVMVGALLVRKEDAGWRNLAVRGAWMTATGLVWWALIRTLFDVRGDANPLTCMPIILVFLIGALGWRVWRMRAGLPLETGTLLLLSVFALVSILRVILKV